MRLSLWNTFGKELSPVEPANKDGIVRIYHCGPTVYNSPHIGNIRRFVVADVLNRTLRYFDYDIRSVMNITDVGHLLDNDNPAAGMDRMEVASQREGKTPEEIAAHYAQEFFTSLQMLRAEPAEFYPRATMHVRFMIELAEKLLKKEFAYETSSGIYFDVSKFSGYGKLSGNKTDAVEEGARVAVREEKKHPNDFALWIKAPKEHLMQWDSPWGRGYPGWHIECSAMSLQLLGETIDIHTGGVDNIFPHHENEIAQSEAANGKPFAKIWVHNEHLLVDGKKMAKSDGTFIKLEDVVSRGYSPIALRFLYLQTHYRSKLNFTWQALDAATEGLSTLQKFVDKLRRNILLGENDSNKKSLDFDPVVLKNKFQESLADDLGTPQALAVLFDAVRTLNPQVAENSLTSEDTQKIIDTLMDLDKVLAIMDFDSFADSQPIPSGVAELVARREKARAEKDFNLSDSLRKEIAEAGFNVEDTPQGQRVTPKPKL
jgi:cysteinyl-tRNA synthetase